MTGTDNGPEQYDPEATSSFKVGTLSERLTLADEQGVPPHQVVPTASVGPSFQSLRSGPALYYQYSDGRTICDVDLSAPRDIVGSEDARLRELMLARALLRHALHLVDKELNGL